MKALKISFVIILVALIGFRLYLPHLLLNYVIKQANKIPGYHVTIKDLDVALYRGSYTLVDIQLWKTMSHIPVPYFSAKNVDFSIQWEALLHGKLVAKIIADHYEVNFVTDPNKQDEQLTIDQQWLNIVKSLYPLNINRLEAKNGEVYFRSYKGHPPFNTYIKDARFITENMQNVQKKDELLSSSFQFTGKPMGGGNIVINGRFDPFVKAPTFYLKGSLTSLSIVNIA